MSTPAQASPAELLRQAVNETPVNVALAQSAFAAFNANLPLLDDGAKVAAIDEISRSISVGVERLEYDGATEARDQFLGQSTLLGMIRDGATAQQAPKPAEKTRTRGRQMGKRKS